MHSIRAPSPDGRPSSRFGKLRKKVSLATLISGSSSPQPDELVLSSRSTSSSSSSGTAPPTLSLPDESQPPSPEEEEDSSEPDEDQSATRRRFVKKSAWRTRYKTKLHPYPDVPYPQAYDPVVLQSERATHHLLRRLAPDGSPVFYTSAQPPASVLDLGCGAGIWLLDAARTWRATQFIGFDLVDVAAPALTDGSIPNVRVVRGDFLLCPLPFPDSQFELVRMANLQLAIPQHQWESVLCEVRRVLVPGGRIELIYDDTFFPYGDVPAEELDDDIPSELTPGVSTHPLLSPSTPRPPPPTPDAPETPVFDDFNIAPMTKGPWSDKATASVDLERIYTRMLSSKLGVNPRAGEVALPLLERVFGKQRVEDCKTLHLKLAPVGCEEKKGVKLRGIKEVKEERRERKSKVAAEKERDKDKDKRDREKDKERALDTPIPQGLTEPQTRTTPTALKHAHTRGGSTSSALSVKSTASSGKWSATGVFPSRGSEGLVQHPGLLLWPATLIPLAPVELEMHTTKHMQTLLGCKAALGEYIGNFLDPETGERMVSDEEFEDALWEYECFRRRRFHWPDLPEGRLDAESEAESWDLDMPTPVSARSAFHAIPPRTPALPESSEGDPHPFGRYDLPHVRTFRVFSAVKEAL
ncbi:hypothetical protein FB45DRAFT_738323 [Roridomyces roridus]|uniref:Methyltransferase domain-containing protein n=1 Tax=Roridomyces roridus TaxID=1738132 RepID=A0AAD7C6Y4_9AGAR|nr:hypothetical protein FB45DRAFT_738323 [Roridomyces roridus]